MSALRGLAGPSGQKHRLETHIVGSPGLSEHVCALPGLGVACNNEDVINLSHQHKRHVFELSFFLCPGGLMALARALSSGQSPLIPPSFKPRIGALLCAGVHFTVDRGVASLTHRSKAVTSLFVGKSAVRERVRHDLQFRKHNVREALYCHPPPPPQAHQQASIRKRRAHRTK